MKRNYAIPSNQSTKRPTDRSMGSETSCILGIFDRLSNQPTDLQTHRWTDLKGSFTVIFVYIFFALPEVIVGRIQKMKQ